MKDQQRSPVFSVGALYLDRPTSVVACCALCVVLCVAFSRCVLCVARCVSCVVCCAICVVQYLFCVLPCALCVACCVFCPASEVARYGTSLGTTLESYPNALIRKFAWRVVFGAWCDLCVVYCASRIVC